LDISFKFLGIIVLIGLILMTIGLIMDQFGLNSGAVFWIGAIDDIIGIVLVLQKSFLHKNQINQSNS